MWRGSAHCTVALTFDFDAESGWMGSPTTSGPAALSRGAYGANEGMPRILKLLQQYELPGTFFVPGHTADHYPDVVKRILADGHEVGHHGYLHEAPQLLSSSEEREVLERGLGSLARHGVVPTGYRSPGGEVSNSTFSLLREYGFRYDSSMAAQDTPYWIEIEGSFADIVEIPFAWELTDSAHFKFAFNPTYMVGMSAPSKVKEIWWGDFDGAYNDQGVFVLTLHPEIIGRHHRMRFLERTIQYMLRRGDVHFVRMSEIADHFRAQLDR